MHSPVVCGLTSLSGKLMSSNCSQREAVHAESKNTQDDAGLLTESRRRIPVLMRTGFKGLMARQRKLQNRESVLLDEPQSGR